MYRGGDRARARGATQPATDVGIEHHLKYLEKTPHSYFTGKYQSAHTGEPGEPVLHQRRAPPRPDTAIWTRARRTERPRRSTSGSRHRSMRSGCSARSSSRKHSRMTRLSRLRGSRRDPGARLRTPRRPRHRFCFPGLGVTTDPVSFGGESPDPLETCGWSPASGAGLPLIVLLPQAPAQGLTGTPSGPGGVESGRQRSTVCGRRVHLSLIRPDSRPDRRRDSPRGQCRVPDSPPPAGDRDVLGERVADRSARHRLVVLRGRSRDPYDDPRGSRSRAHG